MRGMRERSAIRIPGDFFEGARAQILGLQSNAGAIYWSERGIFDPWNHVESAMALGVLGEISAARRAFDYLAETQLADGSWRGDVGAAAPLDPRTHQFAPAAGLPRICDTNFTAYIAAGVWHHYLITGDRRFLDRLWPHVEAASDFVLRHQGRGGEIAWAAGAEAAPALYAGCCSIFKSLECALRIARRRGGRKESWRAGRGALGRALRERPECFDQSKKRFSMDWYYPVLCGVLSGRAAHVQLARTWDRFVIEGLGCRCVRDEPWVTIAESAELAMALAAVGSRDRAWRLFSWQVQWRDAKGAWWMGYQYEQEMVWPCERPGWTSAAMILAADALLGLSPGRAIFAAPGDSARAQAGAEI